MEGRPCVGDQAGQVLGIQREQEGALSLPELTGYGRVLLRLPAPQSTAARGTGHRAERHAVMVPSLLTGTRNTVGNRVPSRRDSQSGMAHYHEQGKFIQKTLSL